MEYTREGYEALKAYWDEEITKAHESGDEFEVIRTQWQSNKELHDYWGNMRTEENQLTLEEIREKYLGKRVTVVDGYRHDTRTLKEDNDGFFVRLQGSNARVGFDPIFQNFKVKHFEPRK